MLQLAHFRRTACVDWLDVRLQIARPTQFQHVQTALKEISGYRLYVAPVFPKAGNVSDTFADRCGFARSYMSRIERGAANPSLDAIEILAGALQVEVPHLFSKS